MLARILTGVVGIPLAIVLIFFPGGLPFAVAIGIVSILGVMEFYKGARKNNARPVEWAGIAAVALFVVSATTFSYNDRITISSIFSTVLTLLLILSFTAELIRREHAPIVNVGVTVLGAIYVGWLISHLVVLRGVVLTGAIKGVDVCGTKTEIGAVLVMLTFLCTWACDTGAYFVGKFLGKTKLAPKLSPNKTWEGSAGGFSGSLIVAIVAGLIIKLPIHHAIALGAMSGILSQLGDLSESAIKREIGIKDFGSIVPGHGGILDRFDSLLFTGPAVYYYSVLFLQHWPK